MKCFVLIALLAHQAALAGELSQLGVELGRIYRESLDTEVHSSEQLEVRKEVSASLSSGILKITLLPVKEIKAKLEASNLRFLVGSQGLPELHVTVSESLPTLQESLQLQSLSLRYEAELTEAESRLNSIFYSTSPYRAELEVLQGLKIPLEHNFHSALNMNEGHAALESMISEFSQLGFRWQRRVVKGKVHFLLDQAYFQKFHQVSSPEFLSQKSLILTQLLQGPVKKLNYLKSVHLYLSKRYGVGDFESVIRELMAKLK